MNDQNIENLQDKNIPKGMVTLERVFNRHDMCKDKQNEDESEVVFEINIGSTSSLRMIKIGKNTSP